MLQITPQQLTPTIVSLFDITKPTMPRAFNVLEGTASGQIFTDTLQNPTWAAVRDGAFGTLYFGGNVHAKLFTELLDHCRQIGDTGFGCWLDDELNGMIPPNADYDGRTLYYTERTHQTDPKPSALLSGYILAERDRALLKRSSEYQWNLEIFGNEDTVLRETMGVVILHGDEIVCEAGTGAPTQGMIEIGVNTAESHRQRGLAFMACTQLIVQCEARGLHPWWDCAKQNTPSVQLAEKLGFVNKREYRYVWWKKSV